jgi:hypothetical protein
MLPIVELLELIVGLHARHVLYKHNIESEPLGQGVRLCLHVMTDAQ